MIINLRLSIKDKVGYTRNYRKVEYYYRIIIIIIEVLIISFIRPANLIAETIDEISLALIGYCRDPCLKATITSERLEPGSITKALPTLPPWSTQRSLEALATSLTTGTQLRKTSKL